MAGSSDTGGGSGCGTCRYVDSMSRRCCRSKSLLPFAGTGGALLFKLSGWADSAALGRASDFGWFCIDAALALLFSSFLESIL
jgi:hypothetical protein